MNESPGFAEESADKPWWPFVVITIIGAFILFGPPIGGITIWLGMNVLHPSGTFFSSYSWSLLVGTVLVSYLAGTPFAAGSGVLHAIAAIWLKRYDVAVPLVSAAVVSLVGVGIHWLRARYNAGEMMQTLALYGAASFAASLACWALTRRLVQKQRLGCRSRLPHASPGKYRLLCRRRAV